MASPTKKITKSKTTALSTICVDQLCNQSLDSDEEAPAKLCKLLWEDPVAKAAFTKLVLKESKGVTMESMLLLAGGCCDGIAEGSFTMVKISDLPKWFATLVLAIVSFEHEHDGFGALGFRMCFTEIESVSEMWTEMVKDTDWEEDEDECGLLKRMHEALDLKLCDTFKEEMKHEKEEGELWALYSENAIDAIVEALNARVEAEIGADWLAKLEKKHSKTQADFAGGAVATLIFDFDNF